ncbi:hypothetical protein GCM10011352_14050 [Marinobacterium zhoushanense]|uniref:DUF3465 domain-containing protein n=1 Tax=Marinobacterium zhoushanense TaxID=1679163 RepID=A0ABQ1K6R3_9GAMM|nr:DUF3465 domain-containing protein [Marinobacterium zhoushanense]GGB89258.1 hypothetical protein GCM10011352_14050 [Marinobacterium zhoushanense]
MKKLLLIILAGFALFSVLENNPSFFQSYRQQSSGTDQAIADAYDKQQSDIQVSGAGVVIRILPDDNDGSRHQRFILRLASGQTLLIAHNIDLAPRIDALREGDRVEFYGEYEWNAKGGVVHWTHHDPAGRHLSGWLKHDGEIYQ